MRTISNTEVGRVVWVTPPMGKEQLGQIEVDCGDGQDGDQHVLVKLLDGSLLSVATHEIENWAGDIAINWFDLDAPMDQREQLKYHFLPLPRCKGAALLPGQIVHV